jgi:hypothetical protein
MNIPMTNNALPFLTAAQMIEVDRLMPSTMALAWPA